MECVKENVVPCDVSLCINPLSYLMGLIYNSARDTDLSSQMAYANAYDKVMTDGGIVLSNADGKYCCPDCTSEHGFYFLGGYLGLTTIISHDGLGKDEPHHNELSFDASRKIDCCVNLALSPESLVNFRDDWFFKTKNKAVCLGYGYLYNFLSITGTKSIVKAIDGWKIPTQDEVTLLINYLGGANEAGGKLKEVGELASLCHWNNNNIGATNKYRFNALGSGFIDESGLYDQIRVSFCMWTTTVDPTDSTKAIALKILNSSPNANILGYDKKMGYSVRLVRPATAIESQLPDGTNSIDNPTLISSYVGNDGKVYGAVKIGTQVWLMENLAETKFSDNSNIPYFDSMTWPLNTDTTQGYTYQDEYSFSFDSDSILKREPCFDLFDKTPPCCKTNFNESYQRFRYETDLDIDNYSTSVELVEVSSFNSRSGLGIILDSLKRSNPDITKSQITALFERFIYEYGIVIKCIGCDIHIYTNSGYMAYLTNKSIL